MSNSHLKTKIKPHLIQFRKKMHDDSLKNLKIWPKPNLYVKTKILYVII